MSIPSPWDELQVEDIPEGGLRTIAEHHGIAIAVDIWKRLGGLRFEVRLGLPPEIKLRYIRNHYDGTNAAQIARQLGVTEKYVRDSLNAKMPPVRTQPAQISFI